MKRKKGLSGGSGDGKESIGLSVNKGKHPISKKLSFII
jgi:hypothetical protein